MGFQKIDYDTWPRCPYFEHYHRDVPCWYSMTADVDITAMALQALDRLRAGQGRLYDLRDIPPAVSAHASPLPWLIAGAAGLAAAGIVIIVIRKRKRVCTK